MVSKLHTSGHGQSPAVQSVHAICIDVTREIGRTADAADGDDFMIRDLQLDEGFLNGREHAEIAAARAPVGIDFAFQIGHHEMLGSG